MSAADQVRAAAAARAVALASGDAARLTELLHIDFRWTSHTGEDFDRAAYIEANTGGRTVWQKQDLGDPDVAVVGDAAVLRTVVIDTIDAATGSETFRMPMTQFWVRAGPGWTCLAGHAGPRLAN
jgi:hypothetical protein